MEKAKYNLAIDCSFIKDIDYSESHVIYTKRLLYGLNNSDVFNITIIVNETMEKFIDDISPRPFPKIVIKGKGKILPIAKLDRIFRLIPFKKQLEEHHIDVVFCPNAHPYIYIYPSKYHQHVILHDLIPFYTHNISKGTLLIYKWMLKTIPYIISISKGTQNSLKEITGRQSKVVHNSILINSTASETIIKEVEGKKYILDINRFEKYKNAETLVYALDILRNKIPHILYLKGLNSMPEYLEELKSLINRLNLNERVIIDTSYRTEGEMHYLYTHSDLFVTPSLLEGFGYTPIEASILGTPVLVSDIPVLKEVTYGKLPTFNPHSAEDLADKIEDMINHPKPRGEAKDLSAFFIEEYSVEKQAKYISDAIVENLHM